MFPLDEEAYEDCSKCSLSININVFKEEGAEVLIKREKLLAYVLSIQLHSCLEFLSWVLSFYSHL